MLTEEQRTELENFTNKGVHSAQAIRRARTILSLDVSRKKTLSVAQVCESVGISRQGLTDVRRAFLESDSIEAFLTRKKRATPANQPKITGDVEAHIVALACSEPPKGYARWTVRILAKKVVELEYVDSLSHTSVSEVLKKRNISLT